MPNITSAQLALNAKITGTGPQDKTLVVKNDPARPLPIGLNVFQLVVTDDSGNQSQPARAEVTVLDTEAPTAIVRPPQQSIQFGQDFQLDGTGSTDVGGGRVVRWEWTLVQQP